VAEYRVTDPQTGLQLRLTGDSPPTQEELEVIFSQARNREGGNNLQTLFSESMQNQRDQARTHQYNPRSGDVGEMAFAEKSGMFRDALTGIMQGAGEFGAGLMQLAGSGMEAAGMGGEGLKRRADMTMEASEALNASTSDNPLLSGTTKFITEVGPTLLVPGGIQGGIAKKAVTGAAAGVGIGAAQYVDDNNTRLGNATLGGIFGGSGPALFGGGKRMWDVIRGNKATQTTRDLIDVEKMLGAEGVLTVGELRNSPIMKAFEQYLDRIPGIGTASFRRKAVEKLQNVANRMLDHYDNSFDDIGGFIQSSLKSVRDKAKGKATQLFNRVGRAVEEAGNPNVQLENVAIVAKKEIARLQQAGEMADEQTINTLNRFLQRPPTPPTPLGYNPPNVFKEGYQPPGPPTTRARSFDQVRTLRSGLSAEIRRVERGMAGGERLETGLRSLKNLQNALDQDIAGFAKSKGPQIESLYRTAKSYYRDKVVPFKGRDFKKMLSDDYNTDNIIASFIKKDGFLAGRGGRVQQLTDRLNMKGNNALKFAVIKQSMDDGIVETTFHPDRFANTLRRLSDANNVIFTSLEKKELDGFTKLVHAAEGLSGQARFGGGLRQDVMMFGGGAAAGGAAGLAATGAISPVGIITGVATIKGISLLLTTKGGRKILANASEGVNDVLMDKALGELQRLVTRGSIVGATQ